MALCLKITKLNNNRFLKFFIFETMNIKENYNLKSLNTFGINADAKLYTGVASIADLEKLNHYLQVSKETFLILGGGSNVLFTKDFDGLVVKINLKGIKLIDEDTDYTYIKVMAGENWDEFVGYCVSMNYGGLENLSLIPGSVGASPVQNIGAYGVELKDTFYALEFFDFRTGKLQTLNTESCRFGYRTSIFKNELKEKGIILSVTFRLFKKPVLRTDYGSIKEELSLMKINDPTIQDVRKAVINIRRSKLPDPAQIGNAGSFFKNPSVGADLHSNLKKSFPLLVSYGQTDGSFKLAAGWLIEHCGWKGKRIGDAGVHEKQALVMVNYGNAKGNEIIRLAEEVRESVSAMFGVRLEFEVNIV